MTNIYTFLKYGHTNAIKWSSSIRMVGQINAITQLTNEMRELYKKATGDGFKHYPVRFPEFFRNVEQINISSSEAPPLAG